MYIDYCHTAEHILQHPPVLLFDLKKNLFTLVIFFFKLWSKRKHKILCQVHAKTIAQIASNKQYITLIIMPCWPFRGQE